jgi:hypothetical protein
LIDYNVQSNVRRSSCRGGGAFDRVDDPFTRDRHVHAGSRFVPASILPTVRWARLAHRVAHARTMAVMSGPIRAGGPIHHAPIRLGIRPSEDDTARDGDAAAFGPRDRQRC